MLPNYADLRKALLNAGATYNRNTFVFPNDAQSFIDRLMDGQSVNIKKEFQFFATPKKVAEMVMDKIEFFKGATVREPSAGQGGLLDELPTKMGLIVDCIELMPENAEILRKKGYKVRCEDFLSNTYEPVDIIVANPPFSKKQDIDHFMHMYKQLKRNGQMAVITSPSWTFAMDKKSMIFRDFINENAHYEEIEADAFKESGTKIKTLLIWLRK